MLLPNSGTALQEEAVQGLRLGLSSSSSGLLVGDAVVARGKIATLTFTTRTGRVRARRGAVVPLLTPPRNAVKYVTS